jgi:tetratricopeptide (TPR) repeat protein
MRTLPRLRLLPVCIVPLLGLHTFYELGTWKGSESLFTRALELNPNNFLAHTNLGAAQLAPDQLRSRVHHFEEAVRLNPTYPEALNNLGMVRAQEGRFFEAKGYFEKALSLNPNLQAARNNLYQVDVDLRRQAEGDRKNQY